MKKGLVLGSLLLILVGCPLPLAKFEDISTDKKYHGLVHNVLKSKKELYIYGITADQNYKKKVDYYVITEPPGIGGPEVLSQASLPKGTIVKIEKIISCTNCLDHRVQLIVSFSNDNKYGDIPVKLRNTASNEILQIENGVVSVNPNLFETLTTVLDW